MARSSFGWENDGGTQGPRGPRGQDGATGATGATGTFDGSVVKASHGVYNNPSIGFTGTNMGLYTEAGNLILTLGSTPTTYLTSEYFHSNELHSYGLETNTITTTTATANTVTGLTGTFTNLVGSTGAFNVITRSINGTQYPLAGLYKISSHTLGSTATSFTCNDIFPLLVNGHCSSIELRLRNFNNQAGAYLTYNYMQGTTALGSQVWPTSGSGSYSSQNIIGAGGVGHGWFVDRPSGVIIGNTVDDFDLSSGTCGTLRFYMAGTKLKYEGTIVADCESGSSTFITNGRYSGTTSGITGIRFTYIAGNNSIVNMTSATVDVYALL